MEAYLNRSIKEVIGEYPAVEKILDQYGIGCGPCAVGSCLLRDIVQIHNLPEEEERELMARIAQSIYPDREIEIPQMPRKAPAKTREIKYSPPMRKLVEEHVLIKRWVALIPEVVKNIDLESEEERGIICDGLDFVRSYADKFHHAKEEEILFKYFAEDLDILKAMQEDHQRARNHVRGILAGLGLKDREVIAQHLNEYGELLSEHIRKEDEILLPWMDRHLSISQVGELFYKFNEVQEQIGFTPEKYVNFIDRLEKKFARKEG